MQSVTSCSKALIRSDWRRFWPIPFLYAWISFFLLPVAIWSEGIMDRPFAADLSRLVDDSLHNFLTVNIFLGLALAMALFFYQMKSGSVGLMHALPVSRTRQFRAHFAAGLSMITAVNVLTFFVSLAMEAVLGDVEVVPLLGWLLAMELEGFFFLSFATLCTMVTGLLLVVPVIYFGLNFVVAIYDRALYELTNVISEVKRFRTDVNEIVYLLTPIQKLREVWDIGELLPVLLIYTVVGILMLALAGVLYRARKSESAGDPIVSPRLRPIVAFVISAAAAIFLGSMTFGAVFRYENRNIVALTLCILIIGASVYSVVWMLMRKSFRIFDKKMLLGMAALGLALIAVCTCAKLHAISQKKRVPEPEEVESVILHCEERDGLGIFSEDPTAIRAAINFHRLLMQRDSNSSCGEQITVRYMLNNGYVVDVIFNNMDLDDPDINRAMAVFLEHAWGQSHDLLSDHNIYGQDFTTGEAGYRQTGNSIDLTPEQCQALYRAMEEDMEIVPRPQEWLNGNYDVTVSLSTKNGQYFTYHEHIQSYHVNTMALLEEYGLFDRAEKAG